MNLLRRLATSTAIMLALAVLGPTNAHAVAIDMVTVGNSGNVGRTHNYGSFGGSLTFGAVNHSYRIGKQEVTISQYTAFLNAMAATDTYSLYNTGMASDGNISGIRQNGFSGNYTYSVIGSPDRPITYVSWFDAARFANWMANGQGRGGTETGAYTLVGATTGNAVARNPGATFYIPPEDEWFKAAYYSPLLNSAAGGYYAYATQSDDAPGNQIIAGALNQANYAPAGVYAVTQSSSYSSGQNYLTNGGTFTGSPSFYGTFDQSGNVTEWNDLTGSSGSARGLRGGDWNDSGSPFGVSFTSRGAVDPAVEFNDVGFRLASPVPEIDPAGIGSVLGLLGGCLGLLEQRRKSARRSRAKTAPTDRLVCRLPT